MAENALWELAFDAETICFQLECGINALDAVCTAMDEGPCSAETFTGALYCVWEFLADRQKEMEGLICKMIREG